jgi:HSP20 family molecular chaperone IbpA
MNQIEKKQQFVIKQIKDFDAQQCYHVWHPATDLFETKDDCVVKLEIGGMEGKDFSINFYKDVLSINGYRAGEEKDGSYHRMEIPFGDFSSSVKIPCEIMVNSIEAFYENGFLTIILPKIKSVHVEISEE